MRRFLLRDAFATIGRNERRTASVVTEEDHANAAPGRHTAIATV
jgi:hypothetical protein